MAAETEPLIAVKPADVSVYGVVQNAYSVVEGGVSRTTSYDMAIATASMQRSVSIESAMSAASAIVRVRQRKMEDMTDLLSLMMQARASLKSKPPADPNDVGSAPGLKAKTDFIKANYGVDIYSWEKDRPPASVTGDNILRQDLEGGLVVLQSAIDENDNQLQQDMLTLQSWVSKRDESFRSASKALKAVLGTGTSIIDNIGS